MSTEKMNILLVDDSRDSLELYEAALQDLGANLVLAQSGEEALERFKEREYAAIVLDIQMPGIDGYETAKRIRSLEGERQTPIIFATGYYRDDSSMSQAYSLGASDYLLKPVNLEALRGKVSAYVELFQRMRTVVERMKDVRPAPASEKILVVHEQLAAQMISEQWGGRLGVEVLPAKTGQDAINHLLVHDVAMIMLGVRLPDQDGFEVAEFIRRNERFSFTPLLFVADDSQPTADMSQGFKLGAVDFIFPPFKSELLIAKSQAILRQFRQARLLKQQLQVIERFKQEIEATRKRLVSMESELNRLTSSVL